MASAGAHRYWSLYILDSYDAGDNINVAEISLRETAGGASVNVPSTPVQATSNYTYSPQDVTDGSTGTYWDSDGDNNQRLRFDLGTPKAIAEMAVYPYVNGRPKTVYVEYSDDGVTFTTATTATLPNTTAWHTLAVEQGPVIPPDPYAPQKTTLTLTHASSVWTNPNNAFTADTSYAYYTQTVGGNYNYLRFNTNALTAIPANAVIKGAKYTIRGRVSSTAPQPNFKAGYGDYGGGAAFAVPTTAMNNYSFGTDTNPTGANTRELLSTGSVLVTNNTTGSSTYYVERVTLEVSWVVPRPGNVILLGTNF